MDSDFKIIYEPPTPIEYNNIRVEGGMSGKPIEAATIGLKNSLFTVCIYHEFTLIGMGRIIGDGGAFFQIVDIVVKPSHQGKGIGKLIMKKLMEYLDQNTYSGSYVSLIAEDPANKLYEQFGFADTFPKSQGMHRRY